MAAVAEASVRRPGLAGGLLGFALGGFFDGIVLHQILQWHHLLSAIDPENARMQVMADGLFHALMYVVALAGLWLLWRTARDVRIPAVPLIVALLTGFGVWHLVDAVMSHWLLGIHRIRVDTATPLLWDLLWLSVFGFGPLGAALWISRSRRGSRRGASATTLLAVAALVTGAGLQSTLTPADGEFTTVLLLPGSDSRTLFSAAASIDARVAWTDSSGRLVVLAHPPGDRSPLRLLVHGALALDSAFLPAGCFSRLHS